MFKQTLTLQKPLKGLEATSLQECFRIQEHFSSMIEISIFFNIEIKYLLLQDLLWLSFFRPGDAKQHSAFFSAPALQRVCSLLGAAATHVTWLCAYANQHFAHLSASGHVLVWTHLFSFYCKAVLFKRIPARRAESAERSGW